MIHPKRRLIIHNGFTMAELMITVAILSILSAVGFASFSRSYSDRQLRLAAIELATVLAKTREIATKDIAIDSSCTITQRVDSLTRVVSATLDPADCIKTSLPSANLQAISGNTNLEVDKTTAFTFFSGGLSSDDSTPPVTDTTVRIRSSSASHQWCVNVTLPASIIRVGVDGGNGTCDYLRG